MLTALELGSFKCFDQLHLPLARLTVLSGLNASGKSTVIQALAALHQSAREADGGASLLLNGADVSLGTVGDVMNQVDGSPTIRILTAWDLGSCEWHFAGGNRAAPMLPVERVMLVRQGMDPMILDEKTDPARTLFPRIPFILPDGDLAGYVLASLKHMSYISAERLGPRETYPLGDSSDRITVGARGEFAPAILYWNEEQSVAEKLRVEGTPNRLPRQVEAWMARFFEGVELTVDRIAGVNLVRLAIRTSRATDFLRPQNVGYGITHILPIVTACLAARKRTTDHIVAIENPEVHLHPAGQAAMGEFIARAAASDGVQVIIETHSDHVLNGVRRAVREKFLRPDQIAIHFFRPQRASDGSPRSAILSPLIDERGNLDTWPEGFFDQFDKDMAYFADWSR